MKDAFYILIEWILNILKYLCYLTIMTILVFGVTILIIALGTGLNQLSNLLNLNTEPMEIWDEAIQQKSI